MMCPTFYCSIFSEMIFTKLLRNSATLKSPYISRITCLPLRSQRQRQRSYQPWGCYRHRSSPSFRRIQYLRGSFAGSKALRYKPFIAKIFAGEHIVLSFAECIISCFDVAVNDVLKEFAEKLQSQIL